VLIGGFAVRGSSPLSVVIRARGPSLPVAGTLENPVLTVVPATGGAPFGNDDWGSDPNAQNLAAIGMAPGSPRESALLVTLQPGIYTVIVSGAGGATGIALVEVYTAP